MLTLLFGIAFGPACYDSPACSPTVPLEGAELCAALDTASACADGGDVIHSVECVYLPQW